MREVKFGTGRFSRVQSEYVGRSFSKKDFKQNYLDYTLPLASKIIYWKLPLQKLFKSKKIIGK